MRIMDRFGSATSICGGPACPETQTLLDHTRQKQLQTFRASSIQSKEAEAGLAEVNSACTRNKRVNLPDTRNRKARQYRDTRGQLVNSNPSGFMSPGLLSAPADRSWLP